MRLNAPIILTLAIATAHADIEVFNSNTPAENEATRTAWLLAMDVNVPLFKVDFDTGFKEGDNISGQTGLFPAGLVITDTSIENEAIIDDDTMGGSNPVGLFAVRQNEQPFLELDFSDSPVDYVAFQDIDQAGTNIIVTFTDQTTTDFNIETTSSGGNTAEFVGIWRNDLPQIIRIQLDASGDGNWGLDTIEYGVGSGCIADCDANGALNILDFVCYQQQFSSGDLAADCNGDGNLNILDFVCFQQAFVDGC